MLVIKQFGPVTYAMGSLQEILAGTGISTGVRALPNDVAGCTLEMGADGKWVGCLGTLTQEQADALVASGAMASVAVGTPGNVAGVSYSWSGDWCEVVNTGIFPNENTYFDFRNVPDGSIPTKDSFGKDIAVFNNPSNINPVISGGGLSKPGAGIGAVYMDTLKHVNDISEAGCVFQLRDSGAVAICLWSDYTSVIFPAGHLNTACHLVVDANAVHFDLWVAGVYVPNLAIKAIALQLNVDISLVVRFSGVNAQVFVNGDLALKVADPRIATLGRKVGCFELYVAAAVLGPKIISGYTLSDAKSAVAFGQPLAVFQKPIMSVVDPTALTITGTFQTILPAITVPSNERYCFSVVAPIVQTAVGEIYVDALVTHANATVTHFIVTISTAIVANQMPAMLFLGTLVVGDTVTLQIAKNAGAAGSIPAPTGYNKVSGILTPIT